MAARHALLLLVFVPMLSAASARAATASSPWLEALSNTFTIVDVAEGDLDGDGKADSVVCYQESDDNPTDDGGIAILRAKGNTLEPAYHVRLDQAWCEQVKIQGNQIGFLLRSRTLDKKRGQLVWTLGKDFDFAGRKKHFLSGARTSASSSAGGHGPSRSIDGDTGSSWSEGEKGTGIAEKLTIKLPRAMDVAYVGIYGGHGGGKRAFFDNNRIHRGSVEARTEADFGDALADIDFSELGIGPGGDRLDFSLENRPQVTYVKVNKTGVTEIEIRIESVFLGRKTDDTHIAEVEIVPTLKLSETLDRAGPVTRAPPKKKASKTDGGKTKKNKELTAREKSALQKLDKEGRGLEVSGDW